MTVPSVDQRSHVRRRLPMRWVRFVALGCALAGFGVAVVCVVRPEERFRPAETVAEVQFRVVPKFAPTAESLRRHLLSTDSLSLVWKELRRNSAETADSERESDIVEWRRRLRVEIDTEQIGDRRSVRIVWPGTDDAELGAKIVDALARHYADEISAERWYGSVDRLRTKVNDLDSAVKDVLGSARQQVLRQDSISTLAEPIEPRHGLGRIETLASGRYEALLARRARLAATMQPEHPELQSLDTELAAISTTRGPEPTIVLAAAAESPDESDASAPQLIAPNAPAPVTTRKKNGNGGSSPGAKPSPSKDEAVRRLEASRRELQTQMDAMLLPREAEFPVIVVNQVGMHVGHLRPIWYAGVGMLSLVVAAACSFSRIERPNAGPTPILESPIAVSKIDAPPVQEASVSPTLAVVAGPQLAALPEEESAPAAPSDPLFHEAGSVEARLAAPVLAVVRRRRPAVASHSQDLLRRAA
ncbi:MAG: hypothetical protein K8U03_04855 [Planctomycetia bacterium]|nr:hypothetical protein [Planctomycetia bacterium]